MTWYRSVAPSNSNSCFQFGVRPNLKKPFVKSFTNCPQPSCQTNIELHTIQLPRFFTKNLIIRCILDNSNSFRTVVTIEKEDLSMQSKQKRKYGNCRRCEKVCMTISCVSLNYKPLPCSLHHASANPVVLESVITSNFNDGQHLNVKEKRKEELKEVMHQLCTAHYCVPKH